ncbi:MAG: GDP-mannose 4,6-dehydratase, partial [Bacteroidetes bacterium]|nr:GDP-mannose 4,6-dehydratase [Bacteroidota bacterium]
GDSKKAKEKLGWEAKVRFEELVKVMVKGDVEKTLRKGY